MPICIYSPDCTDFSTNGLGLLTPIECYAYAEDGHYTELELVQPIDATYRWAQLQKEYLIKAPVPARESPIYEQVEDITEGQTVTVQRQVYRVRVNTHLRLRSGPGTNFQILDAYANGVEVVRLETSGSWYRVAVVKGGKTGWMYSGYLTYVRTTTETITQQKVVGQRVVQYKQAQDQIWRIFAVEPDTARGVVTARAQHWFYDVQHNVVDDDYAPENIPASTALQTVWDKLMYAPAHRLHIAAGLDGVITGGDYGYKNPVECLLEPDSGILPQAKARLVLDNLDVWILPKETRDCGVTIRRRKNLKGVKARDDDSGVITRVVPCGKTKNGDPLYINDGTGTYGNGVDSPHINEYPHPRVKKIEYDVQVVDKDADGEKTFPTYAAAQAKLKTLAQAEFTENGIDLPSYGMTVDFVLIETASMESAAADYTDYAALQTVFLGDTVTVSDSLVGLTAKVEAVGFKFNCLTLQYASLTLGDVDELTQTVYSYQLPTGGISGSKIAAGTADGGILRNLSVQYAKISAAAIQQLSADAITALNAYISNLTAETVKTDTLAANFASIYKLIVDDIVADTISAGHITADTLMAALASMVSVSAQMGEFDFATVQNLLSQAMILQQGYADSIMITNLAVTSANMLDATIGRLVLRGDDDAYYEISVGSDGVVSTKEVELTAEEIAAGETADGRQIVQEVVNARSLNGETVKASEAILNTILASALTAGQITANEALIASASIPTLYTVSLKALGDSLDLSANQSINFFVGQLEEAIDGIRIGTRNYLRNSRHLIGDDYGLTDDGAAASDACLTSGGDLVITVQAFEIALPGRDTTVTVQAAVVDGCVVLTCDELTDAELDDVADLYGLAFEIDDDLNLIATVPASVTPGSASYTTPEVTVYDGTTDTVLALTDAAGAAWRMEALPFDETQPAFFSVWAKAATVMSVQITAAGQSALAAIGTDWTRICMPIPEPDGAVIEIAPLGSGTLYLYKAMLEAAATRVSDWTCAPEDTEAEEAAIRGVADSAAFAAGSAQDTANEAMAVAQAADETSANVRRWMSFTTSGLYQGKAGSTYSTLIDDQGFHILQLNEKIGSFAKRRLEAEEVRVGKVNTVQPRCVLREAGDGGMIITVEGLT